MREPPKIFRVLIIEDDSDRAERLISWIPEGVRTVVATSAGKAMGVLQRDRGHVYAGILLDHDLRQQAANEMDSHLSGTDLVDVINANVANSVPILIHSMNASRAAWMAAQLDKAGFSVTQVPIESLTEDRLLDWLREARSIWEELQEE